MKCLNPQVYKQTINGSIFEAEYPCGKCASCRRIKHQQTKLRILLESTAHEVNSFITLTYSDIHCPWQLEKAHARNFIKRYRKLRPGKSNRYYIVGEYGSRTNRPHYHAILFGHSFTDVQTIENAWRRNGGSPRKPVYQSLGYVHSRDFTTARAGYVAKYATKFLENIGGRDDGRAPEFATSSRGYNRNGIKVRGIGLQQIDDICQSIRRAKGAHKKDIPLSEYFETYVGSIRAGTGRMSIDPYLRKCIYDHFRELEKAELESELDEYNYLGFDNIEPTVALIKEQRKTDLRRAVRRRSQMPKTKQQRLVRNIEADISDKVAKRKMSETQRKIKI